MNVCKFYTCKQMCVYIISYLYVRMYKCFHIVYMYAFVILIVTVGLELSIDWSSSVEEPAA